MTANIRFLILLIATIFTSKAPAYPDKLTCDAARSSLTVLLNEKEVMIPTEGLNTLEDSCKKLIESHLSAKHATSRMQLDVEASAADVLELIIRAEPRHGLIWKANPRAPVGIKADTVLKWKSKNCERYKVIARICYLLGMEPSWDKKLMKLTLKPAEDGKGDK